MVESIARAILYEGYLLYPYRLSAVKNRQRFNFGVLAPKDEGDNWQMQTECLLKGNAATNLKISVRFLQIVRREIGELAENDAYHIVPSLEIEGKIFQTLEEAIEREIVFENVKLFDLAKTPQKREFSFPASETIEHLTDKSGAKTGIIRRKMSTIFGLIEWKLLPTEAEHLFKVTVRISNLSSGESGKSRSEVLQISFVSTHTVLSVESGEFISLLETPENYRRIVESCCNIGTFPVLVGGAGERNCVLSSPIILYDYPNIAPESAGELFDGLEIDEILTLRILTLTDEEKREMRGLDERTKSILERSENLSPEQLMRLHGIMRK